MAMTKPKDADEYINSFPPDIQSLLQQIRSVVKEAAPHAREVISYGMPAYKLNGVLVYFAAQSKHLGFYPGSAAIEHFKNSLTDYNTSKGTIQLPFDKALPLNLISKIVEFRILQDAEKVKKKKRG